MLSSQADKRARQRAKEKERKDGKEAAAANNGGSKGSSTAAAAGGDDSFDAELAAAMAEAAAISSRWVLGTNNGAAVPAAVACVGAMRSCQCQNVCGVASSAASARVTMVLQPLSCV